MLSSASISDKNKYQLVKETIQKIDPKAIIYEEDNNIIDIFDEECINDEIFNVCDFKGYKLLEENIVNIRKQVCNTVFPSSWNNFYKVVNKAVEDYFENKNNN